MHLLVTCKVILCNTFVANWTRSRYFAPQKVVSHVCYESIALGAFGFLLMRHLVPLHGSFAGSLEIADLALQRLNFEVMPHDVPLDRKFLTERQRTKVAENKRFDDVLKLHVLVNGSSGSEFFSTEVTKVRPLVVQRGI